MHVVNNRMRMYTVHISQLVTLTLFPPIPKRFEAPCKTSLAYRLTAIRTVSQGCYVFSLDFCGEL